VSDERFRDLYVFSYRRLVARLVFVFGDEDLARDAVDEACARAAEQLDRGLEIESLEAWVRVVSRNVALGRLRRLGAERRARERLLAARPTEVGNDSDSALDVRAALAALPLRQREIVVLHYFFDQGVESIGHDLDVPVGTVKSALHRARMTLAQLLDENGERTLEERR
jgi:RNA polymerase sigma-70 factor (ECF subfamily)